MNKKEIEVIKSYIDGVLKGKEQGLAELNNVIFSLINIETTLFKCEKDNEELKKLREENRMLLDKMSKESPVLEQSPGVSGSEKSLKVKMHKDFKKDSSDILT